MESGTLKFNIENWPIIRRNVKRNMTTYLHDILDYDMSPRDMYELRLLVWYLENEACVTHMMNECSGKPSSVFDFIDKSGDKSPWSIHVKYDYTFMFEGIVFIFKLMGSLLFRQRFTINEDNTLKLYHLSF